jgi:hypothetical protein
MVTVTRDSSVGIATDYRLDNRMIWVRFPTGTGNFIFSTASRPALGPTQPPIQWVRGTLSLGVKRSGREDDHSPPSSSEVKECVELHLHFPNMLSWRGSQLKHRDNCTFTSYRLHLQPYSPSRWRRYAPPKRWYPTTSLYSIIAQKTMTWGMKVIKCIRLTISMQRNAFMICFKTNDPQVCESGNADIQWQFPCLLSRTLMSADLSSN